MDGIRYLRGAGGARDENPARVDCGQTAASIKNFRWEPTLHDRAIIIRSIMCMKPQSIMSIMTLMGADLEKFDGTSCILQVSNSGWPTRSCPPTPFRTQPHRMHTLGILVNSEGKPDWRLDFRKVI